MNNNKQTAVEWLINQISLKEIANETFLFPTIKNELIEQAKAMHKNEIINAVEGFPIENRGLLGEDYYNETYGK